MTGAQGLPTYSGPAQFIDTGHGTIAYRKIGAGSPLLLIHGYPLTGHTWRKMLPALAAHFTCYVLDMPGAGKSLWSKRTNLGFAAQTAGLKMFADKLNLASYAVLANDTGGTIARQLAIIDAGRVTKLVAIGTEIPNHRPPYIRMQQRMSHLPGASMMFRRRFMQDKFLLSAQAFGGCFSDPALIKGEFHHFFIAPVIESRRVREGQIRRLQGIEWPLVDGLAQGHGKIDAAVLLIWGEDDPVFPLPEARKMVPQFRNCRGLKIIQSAKLFVHEERPDEVSQATLDFLLN